jgi:hypothetical protein
MVNAEEEQSQHCDQTALTQGSATVQALKDHPLAAVYARPFQ